MTEYKPKHINQLCNLKPSILSIGLKEIDRAIEKKNHRFKKSQSEKNKQKNQLC